MSTQTVVVAIVALICGVSAAVAVNQYYSVTPPTEKPDTTSVVVAALDVPRATALTRDMLTIREWPKDMVPPGAITNLDDALDQSLSMSLVQGEPVLEAKLGQGRGIGTLLKPGMRAFTILTPTESEGVGGYIMPGDHVDVVLTVVDASSAKTTGGGTGTTLLQNVEILAVEDKVEAPIENKVQQLRYVTLACTPEMVLKLSLAQKKNGTLSLSLRPEGDDKEAVTDLLTFEELWQDQMPPQPEPTLTAPEPVPIVNVPPQPRTITRRHSIPEIRIRTYRGRDSGAVIVQPAQEIVEEVELKLSEPPHVGDVRSDTATQDSDSLRG